MTRLPRYKRFEYTPRHYDPDKEELEDRIRQIKQEMGYDVERTPGKHSSTIRRGSFRRAREQAKVKASRASNIRLVVILAMLLLIAYLIFFY